VSASATWVTLHDGNDFYWRAQAPAKAVGGKVVALERAEGEHGFFSPNTHTPFPWTMVATTEDGKTHRLKTRRGWDRFTARKPRVTKIKTNFPAVEGTVIFTRPNIATATIGRAMREHHGWRVVGETDDNYFANQNLNLWLRQVRYSERDKLDHAQSMMAMDALVFSTTWLLDRYYKEFRQRFRGSDWRSRVPELFVCRNHIALDAWPERTPGNGQVRVGFMGSTSHVWDVNIAYASFAAAKDLGCETHMIGYNPADPDPGAKEIISGEKQLRSERSQSYIDSWSRVITHATPWIAPGDYHRASLPLDIGLCPLLSNDFCFGRSDLKAIEYTISGAAVVATNNPVYNWFWKHEENCLLANSHQEMAEATIRLIRDPKLRFALVEAAQEKIIKERGLDQMRNEWKAVL
jgi:glycosyltransferase involved in cell wall biosynthesis